MDGGSTRKGVIKHRLLLTSNQAKQHLLRATSWSWSWSTKMVEYALVGRTKSRLIFQWCWNARERLLWLPDLLLPLNFSLSRHFSSIWLSNALLRPPYCWSTYVKVFSSRILHILNFRSPQVFLIFQFCFSRQSTKYFVFLYLVFLQHSTRYFFCWNWLGCSKLSKVCGQQGERKTNFPRDDGPWRKVFHLKNIFHLPLGQNKGKASKKREYCKSLFTFIVVYQIQVRSLPDLVNEQYFRILLKVLKLNSRNLSKSDPTSFCVIHHSQGQKLFHLKSSKLSFQSYRKVLSILWSQSLES